MIKIKKEDTDVNERLNLVKSANFIIYYNLCNIYSGEIVQEISFSCENIINMIYSLFNAVHQKNQDHNKVLYEMKKCISNILDNVYSNVDEFSEITSKEKIKH